MFVYVGQSPAAEFLPESLARDATGHIVVDAEGRTSTPTVFAVGDVRAGARHYLSDAIADGQRAAQAVIVGPEEELRRNLHAYLQSELRPRRCRRPEKVALKPVNWMTDAIALISNSKPNARELLWGIRDKLSAHRQVENIKFLAKNSASQPAPKELLQEVAANYKAAMLALGD